LLQNPIITQAINSFTYELTTVPYDAPGPFWTYTVSKVSGASLITTVASGTDSILVGKVISNTAGISTGPITDSSKVGSSIYRLTGYFNAKFNGQSVISTATYSTDFNIHVVGFTLTPPSNILYAVGETAIKKYYSINYVPFDPEVPAFTYSQTLLEDTGSSYTTLAWGGII